LHQAPALCGLAPGTRTVWPCTRHPHCVALHQAHTVWPCTRHPALHTHTPPRAPTCPPPAPHVPHLAAKRRCHQSGGPVHGLPKVVCAACPRVRHNPAGHGRWGEGLTEQFLPSECSCRPWSLRPLWPRSLIEQYEGYKRL